MIIYLISLLNEVQRREEMEKKFPGTYKEFIMIEAIDGSKLTAKEYFEKIRCHFFKKYDLMTVGEVGCSLSHMKAYEKLCNSSHDYALIIEDDIIGKDEDIEKIKKTAPKVIESFGDNLLWLVGAGRGNRLKKYVYCKNTDLENVYFVHKLSRKYITGTFSYIVTRKAAKSILENQKLCLTLADRWNEILSKETVVLYSQILEHPFENNSLISIERKQMQSMRSRKRQLLVAVKEGFYNRLSKLIILSSRFNGYNQLNRK
ncbi:hypothetical protein AT15_06460 [Kosmotoga arenicorallina S304]|uniref:Glycosyl transferase family 25 domain-containing protein n=1 Tax=Kosmotoga arenicorallina S304 TaxID=1453497 RepID=A0A176JTJ8_9BACT|nr:glycosyltransferase family 25 protein [Kosmotoga arenicorallina]OAA26595.1 hypothetical protein AT15_06460 [Kosmotoga arenicorallina S304]